MFILGLIIGLAIGAAIGVVLTALTVASHKHHEAERKNEDAEGGDKI